MLGGKKNNQFAKGGHTLFDHAVEIQGTVTFGGTLDIEGRVIGDVLAAEGPDAQVNVREKGMVEGEIRAPKIIVNGKVMGDIYSSKHLELASNAIVHGNVHYHVIEMVKGAQVNGSLIHVEDAKPGKNKEDAYSAASAQAPQASAGHAE